MLGHLEGSGTMGRGTTACRRSSVFRLSCSAGRVARAATTPQARRALLGAAVSAALVLGAAACSGGATAQDTAVGNGSSFVAGTYSSTLFKPGSRPAAPAVHATTLTGAAWRLSADRGDVVVLNFWGSWCTPCREEAPALGALAQHFAKSDVRFVGVDIRDDPASAEAYMRKFRISYPSLNDPNDRVALDFNGTVPPAAIPTTLVIDRAGRIAARVIGQVSYNGLKALITQVSAERS
jgi:thiol-disulfide isomerase/thioredoxin